MWIYEQKTGRLLQPDGKLLAVGYSGHAEGKNNPALQAHANLGPIPCGRFRMELITDGNGNMVDYEHKKAPVIRLIPQPGTQMFGRAGFLLHGDSIPAPGTASLGCVVENHAARMAVAFSPDKDLDVVSGESADTENAA